MSEDLLTQGIAEYNAGRTEEAGDLFLQLLEREPDHELAWLWLSGTVETDRERLRCLERVVEINPHNGIALRGIESLRKRVREPVAVLGGVRLQTLGPPQGTADSEPTAEAAPAEKEKAVETAEAPVVKETGAKVPPAESETGAEPATAENETNAEAARAESEASAEGAAAEVTDRVYALLRQAVDAIKAGDPETGQPLLIEALKLDEDNEAAWLWMTRCVTESDLKRECFERVLEINPENTRAIRGLKRLQAALEAEGTAEAEEDTEEEAVEAEEGAASGEKPRFEKRTKVLMGIVAAAALIAVVLLVFAG